MAAQTRLRDRFFPGNTSSGDIASAGNGGVTTSANGGAVSIGDVNSGGNAGNAIGVGNTYGAYDPSIYGGDVTNTTALGVSANGGTRHRRRLRRQLHLAFVS